jgi:hypothetical protein
MTVDFFSDFPNEILKICRYLSLIFESLAVSVFYCYNVLTLNIISGDNVLQGLEGFLREGGGSAEDLSVQGSAEVVGGSVKSRSA